MKIDKLNIEGKINTIEVSDKIVAAKINNKLVSNVLYKTNANYKGRKAKTKQKNEIKGSTAKIYAQKGTGNARHASKKAPIFVGGGVAHGPKGELNYKKKKLNKSEKKLSIASLITKKNVNDQSQNELRNLSDNWFDTYDLNNQQLAELIQKKKIDVLIAVSYTHLTQPTK